MKHLLMLILLLPALAVAALDDFANFAHTALSTGIDDDDTSLTVTNAARLPTPPFNASLFDSDLGPDLDPDTEIVRVTAIVGTTLTVTRAQEGTSATAHNTDGQTYILLATVTAKTFNSDIPAAIEAAVTNSAAGLTNYVDAVAAGKQDDLPAGSNGEWLTLSGGVPDWAALPSSTNLPNLTVTNNVALLANASVGTNFTVGGQSWVGAGTPNFSHITGGFGGSAQRDVSFAISQEANTIGAVAIGGPLGGAMQLTDQNKNVKADFGVYAGDMYYTLRNPSSGAQHRFGFGGTTEMVLFNNSGASFLALGQDLSSGVNYKRLSLSHDGTDAIVAAESAGTGGANQNLVLRPQGTGIVSVTSSMSVAMNLGVGQASSGYPLEVNRKYAGDGVCAAFLQVGGSDTGIVFGRVGANGALMKMVSSSGKDHIAWAVNGSAVPAYTQATQMALNESGRLGIGTTDPSERLHVAGNILAGTNITANGYFAQGSNVGISVTNDVLVAGGTTNRMVFAGGILISNIANFYP